MPRKRTINPKKKRDSQEFQSQQEMRSKHLLTVI
uniref:Uncharacterized protein n=1 Tax=Rhizophora mucronata TaxID=61149 RepID=A0A2P2PIR4_RHIMU